jgi:uncharacterized repeat protein (TIGR03843 family)
MTEGSADALDVLRHGTVEVLGLFPYSSNYTFLARLCREPKETLAVYKPRRGERPLWDFPRGTLARREVAAYLVSRESGWGLVPPTVLRSDAPLGEGSFQLFIEHDPERHYFTLIEERPQDFVTFAALDVVINNADRKAGHVLEDPAGRLWGVDHGLSFHREPKLRTVIWAFAGEAIDERVIPGLERLVDALQGGPLIDGLRELLSDTERSTALDRARFLLDTGRFPLPSSEYHLPWPLI